MTMIRGYRGLLQLLVVRGVGVGHIGHVDPGEAAVIGCVLGVPVGKHHVVRHPGAVVAASRSAPPQL